MYTITVKTYRTATVQGGRKWAVVGKDDQNHDVMGYTPDIQVDSREFVDVYEQTVDSLDLVAVIRAVNGIAG